MEHLIHKILAGDRQALRALVTGIQPNIYNLSLRFLWTREDAEDATQEILVKIITNLARFEGKSKFTTWAYRIAVNYLLNCKKNKLEQQLNFTGFKEDIMHGLQSPSYDLPDRDLLAEEVKLGCTLGMLLCLDRNLRIAYILSEVFELNSQEAAIILNITPENFRKRLSKARRALQDFMQAHCGLVNPTNPCRCHKRIQYAMATGRVHKTKWRFVPTQTLARSKTEMEKLYTASVIYKSHPSFIMDAQKGNSILQIIGNLKDLLQ